MKLPTRIVVGLRSYHKNFGDFSHSLLLLFAMFRMRIGHCIGIAASRVQPSSNWRTYLHCSHGCCWDDRRPTFTILKFDAAHFHYLGDAQPGVQCNDPCFARMIVTRHNETVFHVLPSCWCRLQVLGARCFSVDVFCPLRVTGERLFGDVCVCFSECMPVPTPVVMVLVF